MTKPINSRLSEFIKYLLDSKKVRRQVEISEITGIRDCEISSMKSGSRNITDKTVRIFANCFAELNPDWLLTGEGEMLKSEHVTAAPAAGSAASTPPMGDDIRKLRDEISRLSGEVAELRKVILAQNSQLIELLKSEKSR